MRSGRGEGSWVARVGGGGAPRWSGKRRRAGRGGGGVLCLVGGPQGGAGAQDGARGVQL